MNNKTITDKRALFWGNALKVGALVVGFLVAPFIWTAIGGLIGLITAGAIILTTWMLRPYLFTLAANTRLALVKKAASVNPVETLQEDLRKKSLDLEERHEQIKILGAKILTFADKMDEIKKKYGSNDPAYIKMSENLVKFELLKKNRSEKWKEAYQNLMKYEEEIDRVKLNWEASLAANDTYEAAGLSEGEFMQKIKNEAALNAIRDSYNMAIASLDVTLMEEAVVSIENGHSDNVIDITNKSTVKIN